MENTANVFEKSIRQSFQPIANDIKFLESGAEFPVVHSYKKVKDRRFRLDTVNLRLEFGPARKGYNDSINLVDVLRIESWNPEFYDKVLRYKSRHTLPDLERSRCLTVVTKTREFNLVVSDRNGHYWIKTLDKVLHIIKEAQLEHQNDCWMWNLFQDADADRNGTLDLKECRKLVKLMNIEMDNTLVEHIFNLANTDQRAKHGVQVLDGHEFLDFIHLLAKRPELEELYMTHCDAHSLVMTSKELKRFLEVEQATELSSTDADRLIDRFERSPSREKGAMTFMGFTALLNSDLFHVMKSEHRTVYQDMTRPLSHYFIASSHNTYLTGNQLTSSSSTSAYINALDAGCRCLELDVWDGPDGEPVVKHGYTVTSSISLQNVLQTIKEHAFVQSDYPVILSLENHLGQKQEAKCIAMIRDVLGDVIFAPPVDHYKVLPSPEQLKLKVVIKASKPDQEVQVFEDGSSSNSSNIMHENLQDFVFLQSVSQVEGECREIVSLSEARSLELVSSRRPDCIRFTQRQLCRIYPKASRQDSSNMEPTKFWNAGCQLVTFNYQTLDQNMMLNVGKFLQNGSCGFVLKPPCLLGEGRGNVGLTLTLKLISGQNLPRITWPIKGITCPYIKVYIVGKDEFKFQTKQVPHDGFHPIWKQTAIFELTEPDLDLMLISVKHYAIVDQNIAWACVPVTSLAPGYRHIPLMNLNGKPIPMASIFVHITLSK